MAVVWVAETNRITRHSRFGRGKGGSKKQAAPHQLRKCKHCYNDIWLQGQSSVVGQNRGLKMCMMLYIAADNELPLVPWDEDSPGLFVKELPEAYEKVRKHLAKKNVYLAGAHTGCGCGFVFGVHEDLDDTNAGRRSVEQLLEYLENNLPDKGEIELYSCWAGDEDKPIEFNRSIDIKYFRLGESFSFREKEIIVVRP